MVVRGRGSDRKATRVEEDESGAGMQGEEKREKLSVEGARFRGYRAC